MARSILIVDDEVSIVELLKYNLEKEGYTVFTAFNGLEAIEQATVHKPDLILMDVMMPQMDGLEAGRRIKANEKLRNSYLIYLTARIEEYTEVQAFDIGADDYLLKPLKMTALISRLASIFRKESLKKESAEELQVGGLTIKRTNYCVILPQGQEIFLPKKEFEMLYFMAQRPNKVFSRDELLHNIWGADLYITERTIDVHIRKIREKVGDSFIKTIKGVGYLFETH